MFKLRVRYQKLDHLRYLSHLELVKTMERVVRRAELPYALSQGFSPRMRISYSAASPLGLESCDEYFDLYMTEFIKAEECLARLQAMAPGDLMVQHCAYVDYRESLEKSLCVSEYRVRVPEVSAEKLQGALESLLEDNCLMLIKKGKEKCVSIADKIYCEPVISSRGKKGSELHIFTRARNEGSLRLESFVEELIRRALRFTQLACEEGAGCSADKDAASTPLRPSFLRGVHIKKCKQYKLDEEEHLRDAFDRLDT